MIVSYQSVLLGHGDLDERIIETSLEIESQPDSAYLYFKRGKLYFQHEEYLPSIIDLEKSDSLGYIDPFTNVLLAQNYLKIDSLDIALSYIESVITKHPDLIISYKIKGKILYGKDNFEASGQAYEKALNLSKRKLPEDYCSAADAWESSMTKYGLKKAITILDKGLKYHNQLTSLLIHKKNLALNNKLYDLAIEVQYIILEQANRKEFPYYDLGNIYQLKGDHVQSKKYFEFSRDAINRLPKRIQGNEAVRNLSLKLKILR